MITIHAERAEDYTAIYKVNSLAFGRENEAQLVEVIRKSDNFIPKLSLVAVKNKEIVGHILFSPIIIQIKKEEILTLALAPMAVHPDWQKQGIGSQLVRDGLKAAQDLGYKAVVVIGYPTYYPRFGFSPARSKGLEAPFPVPNEAFMVLELVPGALEGVAGAIILYFPHNLLKSSRRG